MIIIFTSNMKKIQELGALYFKLHMLYAVQYF